MTAKSLTIALSLTFGAGAIVYWQGLARARGDAGLTCVASWPEVRYKNYGYDHIVHLRSHCKLDAFCTVSSDASQKPREVVVAPREQQDVLLLRGSPTRQFTPRVACWFRHE